MTTPDHEAMAPQGPPRPQGARAVRPKSAATLILVRRDGPRPRVLMGRRHSRHAFMPDLWVFPGGRIDRADYRAPAAAELSDEMAGVFARHVPPAKGRALALAAVRETWEETGLLLARPAPPRPRAGPWRPFLARGALPDLSALEVVARAITPAQVARRFDTWFLRADAERLISLEREPDCGELEAIDWIDLDAHPDLPLPRITRRILGEVAQQLADPARPRPFLRSGGGSVRSDFL